MLFRSKKINKLNKLKGGRFLGQGSYGCVITPEIECGNQSPGLKSKTRKSKSSQLVSKLILTPDTDNEVNDIVDEITISQKLKKIDPKQQYFITFNEQCRVNKIPKDRNNVVSVRYIDVSGDY